MIPKFERDRNREGHASAEPGVFTRKVMKMMWRQRREFCSLIKALNDPAKGCSLRSLSVSILVLTRLQGVIK